MAHINTIETESIQVGLAGAPPIAGVDLWPSLDPTVPFSLQTFGLNNHLAITNQIGIHNSIGLQNVLGCLSRFGFDTSVGGKAHAEPANEQTALQVQINAANNLTLFGALNNITINPAGVSLSSVTGDVFKNGQPICAPCPSDEKLKKNIQPIQSSLSKILALQGVSFNWKEDIWPSKAKQNPQEIGLIAQDVEKIVPEVVVEQQLIPDYENSPNETVTIKAVKYENLVALLIEGMKEQQEQINSLKQTVQELSTKLENCCP
jgi:hypothetical protein